MLEGAGRVVGVSEHDQLGLVRDRGRVEPPRRGFAQDNRDVGAGGSERGFRLGEARVNTCCEPGSERVCEQPEELAGAVCEQHLLR